MRILLPAHQARSGGLGTSIRGLCASLPDALEPHDELVVLGAGPSTPPGPGGKVARLLREQVLVARAARGVDLLHLPDHRPVLGSRTPFLLTVYDLFFLDHPEWFPKPVARYKQAMFRAALALGPAAVVCGSGYARGRLLERAPRLPRERVSVIVPGLPPIGADCPEARLEDPYFLTVSTIEPRKNHLGLLRAFRTALKRGSRLRWKVVGPAGYRAGDVLRELGSEPAVDVLGWRPAGELERLYRGALFVATPSFAEGFGFPPLEAMARGIPVVCSTGSALDETVAGAALQVPARDEAAWAQALERLEAEAAERERLRALGLERAAEFDWSRAATAYVRCYREALAR